MKQLDMRTGEIVNVKYEATATDKATTSNVEQSCEDTMRIEGASSTRKPSEIVIVFEPNRPSYELRRLK